MFLKNKIEVTDTIIGAETVIEGSLSTKSSIRIEGKVLGSIDCTGDITVGEKGVVENLIKSRNMTIAGTVNGTLKVAQKLHILSTGKFNGIAEMKSFVIEEGGIFEGESHMEHIKEQKIKDNDE